VVSDTHSKPHPDLLAQLEAAAPHAILNAGDIGDLAVLEPFAALAPLVVVRGNIDARATHLPDVVDLRVQWGAQELGIVLTHIAVRGPRLRADARRLASRHRADVLVCGHSHVPLIARDGQVAVFNPGSVGPRRFMLPITWGVLDFGARGLSFRHMDCETGERWQPPQVPG
jgi:hypothetical protein